MERRGFFQDRQENIGTRELYLPSPLVLRYGGYSKDDKTQPRGNYLVNRIITGKAGF